MAETPWNPTVSDGAETPSLPRLLARTLRFTLGVPRNIAVTDDGARVLFVRTPSGTSRVGALWELDVATAKERLIADPVALVGDADEQLSPEERARRERSRESAGGIVAYSTDSAATVAVFALSGQLWLVDLASGEARPLPTSGSVIDPRVDPTGKHVAYASDGSLRVTAVDGSDDRVLVEPDGDEVVWGQAEFVAAEEMDRYRGFWWSPDGGSMLVERYDNTPVPVWHVADPANPEAKPVEHRYPAAGSADADVSLWHVALDGTRTEVSWDRTAYPYLTRVSWPQVSGAAGTPVLQVMSRDQKRALVARIDVGTGATTVVREQSDPHWVDLFPGVPTVAPGGHLLTVEDSEDTHRLLVDGVAVSPVGLQVRGVVTVEDAGVVVSASTEPTEVQVVRVGYDGTVTPLTDGAGVHGVATAGGTAVISRSSLDSDGTQVTVWREGEQVAVLENHQLYAGFRPQVTLLHAGDKALRTAVVFPRDHEPGSRRLPVVMAPYGGPHALANMASSRMFLQPQWLADQGFCVVVADGRGTPNRGPAWERSVRDDLARVTLEDQVDALDAVATAYPDDIDRGRVGITGWSYGGYLAALAVLARPDVFHAAVAGAPVTDWRLYDTFYTERYLGHPDEQPEVYERNSVLSLADRLERPLLIIHGMVDDNVVVAHSLRLSSALLAAGRTHSVLPLTGVTHMTPQETVAENLQLLQVRFLTDSLSD